LRLQLPNHRGQGALLVAQVQAHLKELLRWADPQTLPLLRVLCPWHVAWIRSQVRLLLFLATGLDPM
jgi:hypothetical protein